MRLVLEVVLWSSHGQSVSQMVGVQANGCSFLRIDRSEERAQV